MPSTPLAGFTQGWAPNPVPGSESFQHDTLDAIQRLQQNVTALQGQTIAGTASAGNLTQSTPYPVATVISGKPSAGATVYLAVFGIPVNFSANWPGSIAVGMTKPTNPAQFSLTQLTAAGQTIPVGTITIQPSGMSQVNASAASFGVGDILYLTTPSPQDSTLANVLLTLYGSTAQ